MLLLQRLSLQLRLLPVWVVVQSFLILIIMDANLISKAAQNCLKNIPDSMPSLDSTIDVLSSETIEVNGVVTQSSKYVTDDSAHRFDGMKASDFEPQNIAAAGIEPQPVKFTMSSFESLAYAEFQVLNLSREFEKLNVKPSKNVA